MPSQEHHTRDLISVAVADRSRIHTQLLAEAIASDPGLHVVVPDSSPKGLLTALERVPVDVAVISISLDEYRSGPGLLREMRSLRPQIRGIILLDSSQPKDVLECFRAGAKGIFSKQGKLEDLRKCIRCVHRGEVWASSSELGHLVDALAKLPLMRALNHDGSQLLSAREQEVIQYLAAGMTNREIAQGLKLSHHTVKNYLFRIFDKLGVSNRTELLCHTMNIPQVGERGNHNGDGISSNIEAAESGDLSAQLRLAEHYSEIFQAEGDPQDCIWSYMWYLLAKNAAATLAERIEVGKGVARRAMSPQQLAEAEGRAAAWQKERKKQVAPAETSPKRAQASAD